MISLSRIISVALFCATCHVVVHAQTPQWIWKQSTAAHEQANFRKTITLDKAPSAAVLRITCDDSFRLTLNGKDIASSKVWQAPMHIDLAEHLRKGENHLYIEAQNKQSSAGLVAVLEVDGQRIVTDKSWEAQAHEGGWHQAVEITAYGAQPWGQILTHARPQNGVKAQPVTALGVTTLPGFRADKLYTTQEGEGSWVGITSDPKGRLITVDQYGGVFRVTLGEELQVEPLELGITEAWGAACAFDSLYLFVNGGPHPKRGLYRAQDTTGDDQYDKVEHLIHFSGAGEHGMHSIVPSPDGESLYLVAGNFAKIPNTQPAHRMSTKWGEDHLLPRMADGRGHNKGGRAPGGFIMKVSPDGKQQEVISIGYRNQVDAAFNEDGELFTYDADMEYDIGSPWYRPTRINHVVSGSDWGWRNGSGKWPTYYTDTLPAALNIGPGSPTGVCSGAGAAFPQKYQRALYAADWTYGTMYAIHLERDGASYRATKEEFLSGKPLPLTDQIIHSDGHMYFLTGGRRTTSSLYRLSYVGTAPVTPAPTPPSISAELQRRRDLEALHLGASPDTAVPTALAHIGHDDRFIRHAARVALEQQAPEHWRHALSAPQSPWGTIELAAALARVGLQTDQSAILAALNGLQVDKLSTDQLLAALRSYQLAFTRHGQPTEAERAAVIAQLDGHYPHAEAYANRELAQLLLYLDAPQAVARTVRLMLTTTDTTTQEDLLSDELLQRNDKYSGRVMQTKKFRPNAEQFALAFALRSIKEGWTEADYASYFSWFPRAATWQGGSSFAIFLKNTRTEALEGVADETLRAQYAKASQKKIEPPRPIAPPVGPGRAWTMDEAVATVEGNLHGRDYKSGENLYRATSCATCHPFDGQSAIMGIGPNLTGSANRYSVRDMMENIIHPSAVISDQYGSTQFTMQDGTTIIGRVGSVEDGVALVMTNPFSPESAVQVAMSEVKEQKPYEVSPMPAGLINSLNADELCDLIAYLFSAGDADHEYFQSAGGESVFDGETLDGWKGDPQYWSVKDGTIYGSTQGNPTKGNTFLILDREPMTDFHLTYEGRCSGNNSGVMYRSEIVDEKTYAMKGYQADMHPNPPFLAMLYEERGRGILIKRGETMTISPDGKKKVHSRTDPSKVDPAEWQQYEIIAKGDRVIHKLNGEIAIDLTDQSPKRITQGNIGLQLHAGPEMETQYRNIRLKVTK